MASTTEVAVFIDTNIGTRIALPLPLPNSSHITPSDFIRELELTHLSCFPEMGEIRVVGLKVKRKSKFYHMPESMLLGHVFQNPSKNCFISMDLKPLKNLDGPAFAKCETKNVPHQINSGSFARESPVLEKNIANNGEDSRRKKWMKKKGNNHLLDNAAAEIKKEYLGKTEGGPTNGIEQFEYMEPLHEVEQNKKWNSSSFVETPSEASSQAVSVSGIIRKFFTNSDEGATISEVSCEDIESKPDENLSEHDSYCSNIQATPSAHSTARRTQSYSAFKLTPTVRTPRNKLKTPQVGKRVVNASSCLIHEQKGTSSLSLVKNCKLSELCSSVRSLAFEISDSDD